MSAQDNTEKILRSLHILLSKSEPYAKEPTKVLVDKQQMLDLLAELNKSVYDIMDEYELTKQSRDRAQREFQKKGDEIVWNASRKAEDIYAASVMYTDEALNRVQNIMKEADHSITEIYTELNRKLKDEERLMKKNQLELKATLQDLLDTEKYLKIIEENNRKLQREKEKGKINDNKESNIYANRQTEIKVNQVYLDKLGLSMEEDIIEEKDLPEVDIKINLDADYFQWVEEQEVEKNDKETKAKPELFSNVLRSFTSGKK